nr:hypothetical protein [Patescibacteria group bacterium]
IEYRSDTSSGENMPSLITTKIGKRNNRDVKPENLVPLTEAQLHDLLVFARSNLPKRNSYGFDGSDRISVVSYLQALISNQQQAGVFSAK